MCQILCAPRHVKTPLPACKLTDEQCERLAGYAEFDERMVRKTVGVAPEIISAAVAANAWHRR
jgi:hypothetical protein